MEDELDIRLTALRRKQRRNQSRTTIEELLDASEDTVARRRPSSYEVKGILSEMRTSSTPHPNHFLNTRSFASSPSLDSDESRLNRMHVPPIIKCECNNLSGHALINTASTVSLISYAFVERMRLVDQIIPQSMVSMGFALPWNYEIKGKIKYIDLTLGGWQQVSQFYVVHDIFPSVSLGIDFLRKTQSIVNFEDASLLVGGSKGERIPFLTTRDVMTLSRQNRNSHGSSAATTDSGQFFKL